MYKSIDWFLYEGNTARNELNKSNEPKTKKLEIWYQESLKESVQILKQIKTMKYSE